MQLGVGSVCWLDLGNVVVKLVVGLPKALAVLLVEVLDRLATFRLVRVDGQVRIFPLNVCKEIICFLESVECVLLY